MPRVVTRVRAWAGVWALAISVSWSWSATAAVSPGPSLEDNASAIRLLDVPFVAQTEALCGGAAAAMLARYWGVHGIFAEDFADLVDPQAHGIRTEALTAALLRRGWNVVAFRGSTPRIQRHLAHGQPVMVLVEDAPDRYHYLVVVGWVGTQVIVHDPARAPFRSIDVTTFVDAWAAAGFWTLLMLPSDAPSGPATTRGVPATVDDGSASCATAVSDAVSLATQGALRQAETMLVAANTRCPRATAPVRELAGLRMLQNRWADASVLAHQALTRDPADDHARRVLATSTFVQDDPSGALRVWNRLGEPTIDLVEVHGLVRTRHAHVEDIVALTPKAMLTASDLARARRRLTLLPTATASRISYRPHGGRADVAVTVTERPLVATDTAHVVTAGVRAVTKRVVRLDLASPTGNAKSGTPSGGGGSLVRASPSRWTPRRRDPGSARCGGSTRRGNAKPNYTETGRHAVSRESQRHLGLTVRDWATDRTYWEATTAVDEWSTQGTYGSLGFRVGRGSSPIVSSPDSRFAGRRGSTADHRLRQARLSLCGAPPRLSQDSCGRCAVRSMP